MKHAISAVVVCTLLAGCATSPKSIEASYVSPAPYENMNCDQLREEAARVSNAAAIATGQQSKQATSDALVMTTAIVLFWPAVFFIGGDKQKAAEVASLKGQMVAIESVNGAKDCGIEFQAT